MKMRLATGTLLLTLSAWLLAGCVEPSNPNEPSHEHTSDTPAHNVTELPDIAHMFDSSSLVEAPKVVQCTLSEGTETQCLSLTLNLEPAAFEIGPWCPRNISDGPDVSGIWLESGSVYDADGDFIQNLPVFYDDDTWQLFDPETGKINVTDSKIACEAAARPDVDPEYDNHCVECQISYLDEGISQTYVIPLTPSPASQIAPRVDHAGVGVAFSGVRLDAAAPLEAILAAHTLAPFDDCGGHVNPHVGYHMHAVTDEDCLDAVETQEGHAAMIGLAMDGYPIYQRVDADGQEPDDLDACRGHSVSGIGYHYHVNTPGSNAIIGCHKGETGCALGSSTDACDASQQARRGPPPPQYGDHPDGPPPFER